MKAYKCLTKFKGDEFHCLYNSDQLNEAFIKEVLQESGKKLLADKELISKTRNADSYRITVKDKIYFLKKFKFDKSYKKIRDKVFNTSAERALKAGLRLKHKGILTPEPLLAVSFGEDQYLMTEFCEEALGLDQYLKDFPKEHKDALFLEIAETLSDFHGKGFYSGHLRSANIMVKKTPSGHLFYYIDLDKLKHNHLRMNNLYINTVSRAAFEFFRDLEDGEKLSFLRFCFDFGLKHNIYSKPSQQKRFIKKCLKQIKARD